MKTETKSTEQLVAQLAWDFCEKTRKGASPRMTSYLQQCPNESARAAFKDLVNTDLLLTLSVGESLTV
jgi:hypothetical protein